MEVPVEGKSRQLALQLDAEAAAVLLVHQGDLGPAAGCRALTSRETGPDHLAQVGEESPDRRPQTSVQLLGGKRKTFSRLSGEKASWCQCSLAATYFCPPLDGCRVHVLLPHTLQVCQEDLILRLPKPALGEQLSAADVSLEPGLVQEEEVRGLTLHHTLAKITDRK